MSDGPMPHLLVIKESDVHGVLSLVTHIACHRCKVMVEIANPTVCPIKGTNSYIADAERLEELAEGMSGSPASKAAMREGALALRESAVRAGRAMAP